MEPVVEAIGGLQTQVSRSGYIGLWSRLEGLRREDYTAALFDRRLVQGWLMRATIHTVTAADYWPLAVAVRESRRRWWLRTWGRSLGEAEMRRLAGELRRELRDGPLPQRELHARLGERGWERAVINAGALWVDLVRVPPPGTWDRPRADRYGLAESWVPAAEIDVDEARDRLLRRYLGGFGPAAMADVSGWTGLTITDLKPVVERAELRRFRDEAGRELLDLPDGPLPDSTTPAPPRFIASFDPILLVGARRTQVLPEEFRSIIFNVRTPQSWNTFLLDGQVAGTWKHVDGRVELEPLRRLARAERRSLEEEAHRLESFHAGPSG